MFGCKKKSERPERPPLSELIEEHREAGLTQLEHLRAAATAAFEEPLPEFDALAALAIRLDVNDVRWPRYGEEDGNAFVMSLHDLDSIRPQLYEGLHRRLIIGSQTWTDLLPDARANRVINQTLRDLAAEDLGDRRAVPETIAMIEDFVNLRYLLVLRQVVFVRPGGIDLDNRTFNGGGFAGELQVFDLQAERLVGAVPVMVINSEVVGPARGRGETPLEDLKWRTIDAIHDVLDEAQGRATE